jgi:hypothetical protein
VIGQTIRLRINGTRPLLMHAGRLADPLDPISVDLARITAKRPKTNADFAEIGRREWFGSLWLDGGRPCIPSEALEATFIDAARSRRRARAARAGLMIVSPAALEYDGPQAIEDLWPDERFRLRHAVRVGSAKMMRTRPRFPDWAAEFEVTYLNSLIDHDEVLELYAVAGFAVGVGDWRPRYGKFDVTEV